MTAHPTPTSPSPDHDRPTITERIAAKLPARLGPALTQLQRFRDSTREHRTTGLAAEIAFFAFLSFFPGLLAFAAALGSVEQLIGTSAATQIRERVLDYLTDTLRLNPDSSTYDSFAQLFTQSRPGLLTFGLVGALIASARGMSTLIGALDVAYHREDRRNRLQLRVTATILSAGTIVTGLIVLVMTVLGPLFGAGAELSGLLGVGDEFATAWNVARIPVAFAVLVAWIATVFRLAPDHRMSWRHGLPGATLTATLALTVSLGFNLYLQLSSDGNQVYGVLGGVISLMLWLYLMALVVLLGAEVNALRLQTTMDRADQK